MSLYLIGIVGYKIHFNIIFCLIMFAYFLSCCFPIVLEINCIIIFFFEVKIPLIFLLEFKIRPFIGFIIELKFKLFSDIFASLNGSFILLTIIHIKKLYPHSANCSHLMPRITLMHCVIWFIFKVLITVSVTTGTDFLANLDSQFLSKFN